jgi:hypothetical protein
MLRCGWVLALALCSCAITRDSLGQLPAAGEAGSTTGGAGDAAGTAADGGEGGAAAGAAGAGSGGSSGSGGESGAGAPAAGTGGASCSSTQCDGTGLSLDAYCKLEQARCPSDMAQATLDACANTFLTGIQSFPNACGGESLRVRYAFGSVEYYFDHALKLRAVTTLTDSHAGPCNANFYRYGDQTCAPAGKEETLGCQ